MRLRDTNKRASFNDLQVQKMLNEQRQKEKNEQNRIIQEEKQNEIRKEVEEFKNTSLHLYEIDRKLLIMVIYSFLFGIIAGCNFSFGTSFSCIIGSIFTLIVGKSSFKKNDNINLTNTILWNLSQSLFDFIDLKIPFETFSNKVKWLDMFTFFGCMIYILCSPTNILYSIVTIMIIVSFLVSFAMKDIESINSHVKIIVTFLFIGILVRSISNYVFNAKFIFDTMSLVLLNIFTILKIYTEDVKIYHK